MSMNKKKSKEERERMEKLYMEENKIKEHTAVFTKDRTAVSKAIYSMKEEI